MNKILSYILAVDIAHCHQEIKRAEGLLEKVNKFLTEPEKEPLQDSWGRIRNSLQLGIPSGSGHSLINDVSPELAKIIIETHLNHCNSKLKMLSMQALSELTNEGKTNDTK